MTCLTLFSDATVSWTAGLFLESVSAPLFTWSTTGLVPYACWGSLSCSRLVALVESVPGSERLSL